MTTYEVTKIHAGPTFIDECGVRKPFDNYEDAKKCIDNDEIIGVGYYIIIEKTGSGTRERYKIIYFEP